MSDIAILACKREESLTPEQAAVTGSIKELCEFCGHSVWVVPRNLILREEKNAKIACWICAKKITHEELEKGEPVTECSAKPVAEMAWKKRDEAG
jgi:hypothetical protein